MTDFETEYRELLKLLGVKLATNGAAVEKAIAAAEERLDSTLPLTLKTYYRLVGTRPFWKDAHAGIHPPSQLRRVGSHLEIAIEEQGVCCWGIKRSQQQANDPSLFQAPAMDGDEKLIWYLETRNLSTFLVRAAVFNTIQSQANPRRMKGGYVAAAGWKSFPKKIAPIAEHWARGSDPHSAEMVLFRGDNIVGLAMDMQFAWRVDFYSPDPKVLAQLDPFLSEPKN